MKYCNNCKKELPDEVMTCPYCNTPQENTKDNAEVSANTQQQSKPKKKMLLLFGIGVGVLLILILAVLLVLFLRNPSENITGESSDGASSENVVTQGGNGVQVGSSLISWANMEVDNPSLNLTNEQLEVVSYFDNDYFRVSDYEVLQRYPEAYRGAQVRLSGVVSSVLQADDNTFECIVDMGRVGSGGYSLEGTPSNQLVLVKGDQPDGSRVLEGDVFAFSGRYLDVETLDINGVSGQYPVVTANYYATISGPYVNPLHDLEGILSVAKTIFGEDVDIREPIVGEDFDLDALHAPEYGFYIVTPGNQSNDNFQSFEFATQFGQVRDTRATIQIMRTIDMSADFEHYYLSVFDEDLQMFTLECYNRDFERIWGREFFNVETVPFDYTSESIYLVADNDLYHIDAKTGEDIAAPVLVGQKVQVSILTDGVVLIGQGANDNIMKVDFDGNILWRVSADIDVKDAGQVQVVDGRVIAELQSYELIAGDSPSLPPYRSDFYQVMVVVDENGEIVSEFMAIDSRNSAQLPMQDTDNDSALSSAETRMVSSEGAGLNLRVEPSTGAEVMVLIPDGSTVTLVPEAPHSAAGWVYVEFEGLHGYVSEEYLH